MHIWVLKWKLCLFNYWCIKLKRFWRTRGCTVKEDDGLLCARERVRVAATQAAAAIASPTVSISRCCPPYRSLIGALCLFSGSCDHICSPAFRSPRHLRTCLTSFVTKWLHPKKLTSLPPRTYRLKAILRWWRKVCQNICYLSVTLTTWRLFRILIFREVRIHYDFMLKQKCFFAVNLTKLECSAWSSRQASTVAHYSLLSITFDLRGGKHTLLRYQMRTKKSWLHKNQFIVINHYTCLSLHGMKAENPLKFMMITPIHIGVRTCTNQRPKWYCCDDFLCGSRLCWVREFFVFSR